MQPDRKKPGKLLKAIWSSILFIIKNQMKTRIDKISLESNITNTKSQQNENTMKILENKLIQLQVNRNCGEFLWCIQNWNEKIDWARRGIDTFIYSDPFYSHRNGYKMRLLFFPDGDGTGEGTHLSLYISIIQGEFDNILQWPFRHEVKFDLINQETGLPHSSRILKTTGNPNWDGWKKPTTGENEGIGFHFGYLPNLFRNTAVSKDNQILFSATPKISP